VLRFEVISPVWSLGAVHHLIRQRWETCLGEEWGPNRIRLFTMGEHGEFYKYSSLTKDDSIRLIVLQPSEELAAGVQCSLIHTSLTECDDDISDHYIALCYVWGDEDDRR
jgi:hypothetical protein